MARTKLQKPSSNKTVTVQQPTPPIQDEDNVELSGSDMPSNGSDVEMQEPDATELELERLVFGDSEGFREGIKNFNTSQDVEIAYEDVEEDGGPEGLNDADLFFTDTGPLDSGHISKVAGEKSDEEAEHSRDPPAWIDSDDERIVVSLASAPRLRKLRETAAEDTVSGREYARRLRRQYELLHPVPEWAIMAQEQSLKRRKLSNGDVASLERESSAEDVDTDDDTPSAPPLARLLQDASGLVRRPDSSSGKKRKLRPEVLDIQRLKDISGVQPSAISSLCFHPKLPLLLSSGPASTLYLHHMTSSPPAPRSNPLLTSLHIKRTPLTTTAFHPTDSRIFLSARRRYFYVWNLESGRVEKITRVYGQQHEQRSMERFKISADGRLVALLGSARKGGGVLNILDAHTLQWTCQARVESRGGIAEFEWWSDSRGLCIAGKSGEITEWNVDQQQTVARWQDEGAVGTTTIALGGDSGQAKGLIGRDRWVVVGSSSGIVNVYDRRAWLAEPAKDKISSPVPTQPKPIRTLDHLTTPVSHLNFSPDGQLLAMASRWKKDALRLVHLPSCTVYRNWPTAGTPLGRISSLAFGAGHDGSELLAVANDAGKIRLWEIRA
ncbi:U3 snoRNP protein [Elasticomyces elasticus]|nr:U3 snoRNP protein [Elasticomyces elasticus]KAK4997598.1 U3 snoRNP protein [Elasticomyces elasticus]